MQEGDTLTDQRGHAWTFDRPLGPGLWSRSWVVRNTEGAHAVLRVPFDATAFGDHPHKLRLAAASRAAAVEYADLLQSATSAHLPAYLGAIAMPSPEDPDAFGVLTSFYPESMASKLAQGCNLAQGVGLVLRAVEALIAHTHDLPLGIHGNLRPSNLLIADDGQLALADPLLPALMPVLPALEQTASRPRLRPPEFTERDLTSADTWAFAHILHRVIHTSSGAETPVLAPRGLDPIAYHRLQDALHSKLLADGIPARFVERIRDTLARLLNRALSPEAQPSPPYRFHSLREFHDRLSEVAALLSPRLKILGPIHFGPSARDARFVQGARVEWSLLFETSHGIHPPHDIEPRISLYDTTSEPPTRIRFSNCEVQCEAMPAGPWRYHFRTNDLALGVYELRCSFHIRDTDTDSEVQSRTLEIVPAPKSEAGTRLHTHPTLPPAGVAPPPGKPAPAALTPPPRTSALPVRPRSPSEIEIASTFDSPSVAEDAPPDAWASAPVARPTPPSAKSTPTRPPTPAKAPLSPARATPQVTLARPVPLPNPAPAVASPTPRVEVKPAAIVMPAPVPPPARPAPAATVAASAPPKAVASVPTPQEAPQAQVKPTVTVRRVPEPAPIDPPSVPTDPTGFDPVSSPGSPGMPPLPDLTRPAQARIRRALEDDSPASRNALQKGQDWLNQVTHGRASSVAFVSFIAVFILFAVFMMSIRGF